MIPTIDRLDARCLFSALAGTVWADADSSTTRDDDESGVSGVAVYLDANANGRYDAGEPKTAADADGRYAFDGVAAGTYLVGVVPPAGQGRTTPGPTGSVKGDFDIEITGLDHEAAAVRRAFADAAARWEDIITGELPDIGTIDDLRISVAIDKIDGVGGTLAQSGPDRFRDGLPYRGDMEFDSADVQDLLDTGHLDDTVAHEMAHVLGFGTLWEDDDLLTGSGTSNPQFHGPLATKFYDRLFKTDAAAVPVENKGGEGTADSHWPEATFAEELMTGYDEDSAVQPISTITVGQFADLGYTVNINAADDWNPATHATVVTTPLDLGAKPFERSVHVEKNRTTENVDFGLRADTAPTIGKFTAGNATLGDDVTLSASKITDAESDDIASVSFYAESNGTAGLQGGSGGDTLLGTVDAAANGNWKLSTSTAALTAGSETFYAVASDVLGFAVRRSASATLTAPPPPTRPSPLLATRQSRTSTLLQWKDRSDDEIGFRIQLSTDPAYAGVLRTFNVPADSVSSLLTGLTHGTTYYVRLRAYGYGGRARTRG